MDVKIGVITGTSVAARGDGEEPGRVLQAILADQHDPQSVLTCQAGEEFHPPLGSTVAVLQAGPSFKLAVAVDEAIPPAMDPGGKRIYATDAAGDAEVAEVRLMPDGTVAVFNAAADMQLAPDGTVTLSSGEATLTLAPDGTVTVSNGAASFTMGADGTFTFHGTGTHFDHPVTMASTLEVAGDVTAANVTADTVTGTTDVTFGSISAVNHVHLSDGPGDLTGGPQ